MRLVRSQDTKPETRVRKILQREGYRFRLHRKDLPGNPDIILPKYHTVIFVHGCFWHRHANCKEASTPATNLEYWLPKFDRTVKRDKRNRQLLRKLSWKVITIWECDLKKEAKLKKRLFKTLRDGT